MSPKGTMLAGLLAVAIMGCVLFIVWRLQRLKTLRAEAEKRAVVAFEEMNKLTKDLRDRGRATPVDPGTAPGKRLLEMYPGPKRS